MRTFAVLFVSCVMLSAPVFAATIFVDARATGANDGTSWGQAKTDIAAAIAVARATDDIWVAMGTYGPVTLKNGVRILGGFSGRETRADQSDPDANATTISGGGERRAVTSIENDSSAVLRGFRIVDGFAAFPDAGGGVYTENSHAQFIRCKFTSNYSETFGGAVASWSGSPSFVNCEIFANEAKYGGGAVFNRRGASPQFVNCLFYGNRAKQGGAIAVINGAAIFTNCTITDNVATHREAGAVFDGWGDTVLRNCIVWNNTSVRSEKNELFDLPSSGRIMTATHSNIAGGRSGDGNKNADPLFVNAAARNYRLRANSPCRGTGNPAWLPSNAADLDLDGSRNITLPRDLGMNPRRSGSTVNMGAYE